MYSFKIRKYIANYRFFLVNLVNFLHFCYRFVELFQIKEASEKVELKVKIPAAKSKPKPAAAPAPSKPVAVSGGGGRPAARPAAAKAAPKKPKPSGQFYS